MALNIDWITAEDRFLGLAASWDRLLGADVTPFDRHCWYAAWWRAFGGDAELSVCTAWRNGELAAVFPLVRGSRGGLEAMSNIHTPLFRPLGADEEALAAVASAAASRGAPRVEATALPVGDPSLPILRREIRQAGMLEIVEPVHVSPIVDTAGDYEEWREASKPRWSAPLERFRRKMARDHEARFEIVEPPADLERQLRRGFEVEASGWKGARGTAILSSAETTAFYQSVARAFHARGELRLSAIELDGRVAAFDLTLLHDGRLYLLKTAFDEAFRKLAPGLVMRLSIIERCFELGLQAHELLGDDSEWKRKFSTGERRHATLRAYARRPLPIGQFGYRTLARPLLKRAQDRLRRAQSKLSRNSRSASISATSIWAFWSLPE
jgi:CelD/BcsL family acetyltransferase involved in cellulose biosynthesis